MAPEKQSVMMSEFNNQVGEVYGALGDAVESDDENEFQQVLQSQMPQPQLQQMDMMYMDSA